MSKETKNAVLCRKRELPERLGDALYNADETDLRVLASLLLLADENGAVEDTDAVCNVLGLEHAAVAGAIKFWCGAGLLEAAGKGDGKKKTATAAGGAKRAHRGGAVEHSGVAPYQTKELADLLEKKQSLTAMVDECQRVLGKTVNMHDTEILVGLVDQLGFEEEAVPLILNYAVQHGRATVRYAEKIALRFYDEGFTKADDVYEQILSLERAAEMTSQIRNLFGMGSRDLSTTEKKLFAAWTQKMGYGIDVIRMAYDITIDAIHTPAPKYTNSILEKWYAEGLHTANDIATYLEDTRTAKAESRVEKSYDTDEFFEASLQRSFAEFEKLTAQSNDK